MRMAIAVLCGLTVSPAFAADDDLTVVRRAVQGDEHARPASSHERQRWFRVRVEERGRMRVKVNLPLPFVRTLAAATDDRPGLLCRRDVCRLRLSDVLGALDGGQEFVTIDDADGRIRVWID